MVVARRMTLADFLELPEVKPARELRRGEVSQKPVAGGPHGALQFGSAKLIDGAGVPGRRLRVFIETRVNLDGESYVPDISAYREDRVPSDADGYLPDDYSYEPPDLAVEVASPGQTLTYLTGRCRELVDLGVPVVLLLDPRPRRNRSVRVFRPGAETGPLTGSDVVGLDDVAAGLRIAVDDIFSALRARPG